MTITIDIPRSLSLIRLCKAFRFAGFNMRYINGVYHIREASK